MNVSASASSGGAMSLQQNSTNVDGNMTTSPSTFMSDGYHSARIMKGLHTRPAQTNVVVITLCKCRQPPSAL